jgi:2-keto-3-deoxy-L-fuconate dehydrogenase
LRIRKYGCSLNDDLEAFLTTNAHAFRLDGKHAAVTGAGSGIGRAIALRFAGSGAFVHLLDIDHKAAQEVAAEISKDQGKARFYGCDVTLQSSVITAFQQIAEEAPLNILVNNAGISHIGNLQNTSAQDFDRVFSVNVKGMYNCMSAVVPQMQSQGSGVILNMASIAASSGLADRFAYSMSKGAVVAMTYSVAKDYLAHNIRCNCISPARVHTPFVDGYLRHNYPGREQEMFENLKKSQPIGRMGKPEEIALLALYLCSDEASFITGSDYPIDGGFLTLRG